MKILQYKGYEGSMEYSDEDACFVGKILHTIKANIGYCGDNEAEITQMFHQAVDEYLEFCKGKGIIPENGNSADVNLHLGKDLLETAKTFASNTGQSLNDFIVSAIKRAVSLS